MPGVVHQSSSRLVLSAGRRPHQNVQWIMHEPMLATPSSNPKGNGWGEGTSVNGLAVAGMSTIIRRGQKWKSPKDQGARLERRTAVRVRRECASLLSTAGDRDRHLIIEAAHTGILLFHQKKETTD